MIFSLLLQIIILEHINYQITFVNLYTQVCIAIIKCLYKDVLHTTIPWWLISVNWMIICSFFMNSNESILHKKCLFPDNYPKGKYTFTGRIKLVEIIRARSGGCLPCPGAGPAGQGVPGGGTEQTLGGCREWKKCYSTLGGYLFKTFHFPFYEVSVKYTWIQRL